jgi:multiple sugar transport system substrate-binding protein
MRVHTLGTPRERLTSIMDIPRRTALLSAPVLATAALAGCSTGSSNTQLTFLNAHPGAFDNVARAFEKAHPGVSVQVQSVPFDQLVEQTQARLSSGDTSVDVLSVDPPRLANMVEQGFLTDESAAKQKMAKNCSEAGISSITADGRPWSYPLWTSDNFLYYNQKILDKAGIDPPGPADADRWTWEQVLDASQAAIDAKASRYGLALDQVDRYYELQPMIESFGAGSGLEGDDFLTPAVDTPKWVAFGAWYGKLFADGIAPRGVAPEQMVDVFRSGQAAFLLGSTSAIPQIMGSSIKSDWGITPHPYFKSGKIYTPTDSWAIGINAASENLSLAREFAQFATLDAKGARLASKTENMPPVNLDAFELYVQDVEASAPDRTTEFADVFRTDTDTYALHRPTSVGYVQFETTINLALSDINSGVDPDKVLSGAQTTLTRQLARQRELNKDR